MYTCPEKFFCLQEMNFKKYIIITPLGTVHDAVISITFGESAQACNIEGRIQGPQIAGGFYLQMLEGLSFSDDGKVFSFKCPILSSCSDSVFPLYLSSVWRMKDCLAMKLWMLRWTVPARDPFWVQFAISVSFAAISKILQLFSLLIV